MEAGVAEIALGHVEIALVGIEAEALDIAVGDAEVQHVSRFFCIRHPADGVFFAMFAGTRAGMETHPIVVAFEVLGSRLGQGQHATAIRRGAELLPELAVRSLAEIMVAGQHEDRLALEFPKGFYRPLDQGLGNSGFVEEIARNHDEVGLAFIRSGDHPFERGEAFLDQVFLDLRVLVEGKADVVVGGVENSETHGTGAGTCGLLLSTRTRAALECGKQSNLGLPAKVSRGILPVCRRA